MVSQPDQLAPRISAGGPSLAPTGIATLEVPAGSAARLDLQPSDKVLASQFTTN
jgi:hypothetical protein